MQKILKLYQNHIFVFYTKLEDGKGYFFRFFRFLGPFIFS